MINVFCVPQLILMHFFHLIIAYFDTLQTGRSRDRIPIGARFPAPVQTRPGAHPVSYIIPNVTLLQRYRDPDVTLTTRSYLTQKLKKEYNYTSTPLLGVHGLI
jgi:hypothetical protein